MTLLDGKAIKMKGDMNHTRSHSQNLSPVNKSRNSKREIGVTFQKSLSKASREYKLAQINNRTKRHGFDLKQRWSRVLNSVSQSILEVQKAQYKPLNEASVEQVVERRK